MLYFSVKAKFILIDLQTNLTDLMVVELKQLSTCPLSPLTPRPCCAPPGPSESDTHVYISVSQVT